ncbi:hypothetical protein BDP55DRAFT_667879, partial [Colletotrichum godetiae]
MTWDFAAILPVSLFAFFYRACDIRQQIHRPGGRLFSPSHGMVFWENQSRRPHSFTAVLTQRRDRTIGTICGSSRFYKEARSCSTVA